MMTQDEINHSEWQKDENWGGPRWGAVYFSKKDTRIWVPKRIRRLGWTTNLAHSAGVFWFVGILFGIPLLIILLLVFMGTK